MTDRPIIFSAPMVRGLLREAERPGTGKTQTRRILRKQPPPECSIHYMLGNESWLPPEQRRPLVHHWEAWGGPLFHARPAKALAGGFEAKMPCSPGDRLWVRENWQTIHLGCNTHLCAYRANCEGDRFTFAEDGSIEIIQILKWRPSIHMPRTFSRLTLTVTDVRVQRLQDISEEDCWAEGVCSFAESLDRPGSWEGLDQSSRRAMVRATYGDARNAYKHLWEHINGADAWAANPWTVALTFTVERRNIDAVDDAARHLETRAVERAMGISG